MTVFVRPETFRRVRSSRAKGYNLYEENTRRRRRRPPQYHDRGYRRRRWW